MTEQQQVIDQTVKWVKDVIIKYNICPFARREIERGSIRCITVDESKIDKVLEQLIIECEFLDENSEIETSLVVIPRGFEGFYPYLDLVDIANELLIEQGYEGVYQIATFHPDYCFDDEPYDEPSNYTNRSPYPTLHLIRESSLEEALEEYDEPESIPERNIQFCQRKGGEFFAQLLANCMKP
ncbi:DUF1415 domain-containing protein [Vibrio sp. SS-MA-C1-2]|uniref:DUF1415 domain-containing protein n=1 Tax=Vibrio sp. SS-MA-C1-2 TaxID=2908646 RepID=UPI001F2BC8F4|nr:DUF1415 domain-containing protein [Vibrio sp. SS-MA-C1-2]UJF17568.1 DUF1415 domain-containing protein [Vibrio sp. SS-MA-C1-2]